MCGRRSLDNTATNAVRASWCDASMTLTLPGAFVGGVTFVHVLPASRVTCTKPVLVPTQITPRPAPGTGDGASAVIEPPGAGALTPVAAPAGSAIGMPPPGRDRSDRKSVGKGKSVESRPC